MWYFLSLPSGEATPSEDPMNPKTRAFLAALLAAAVLRPGDAGPAATSGGVPGPQSFATPSGCRVPVPAEYSASWRRTVDEAAAPESLLLYAVGTPARSDAEVGGLEAGRVSVELIPLGPALAPEARAALFEADLRTDARWSRVRRLTGFAYPALEASGEGRVRVDLVTPTRLVRITSARRTSAFDAVVRGFRDAA
jgi:hypothetical protein